MRWNRSAASFLLAAPILLLAACGGDEGRGEVQAWTLSEDLRIGTGDGGEDPLSRIGGVLATPDGGVWVLQPTERDIRVHGPDGGLIRRVGRGGQEPGEFTLPNRMGWWGASLDTVWVADLGLRRLSLFTLAGDFVGAYEMPFVQHEGVYSINQPGAVLPDGSALAVAAYSPIVTEWTDFPLLRYDLSSGRVVSEVASLERTSTVMIRWQDRGVTTALHPLSDAPLVAFAPDGSRVLLVERSTAGGQRGRVGLTMVGAGGDTLWSRSLPYEPQPLLGAEIDSLLAPRIASLQQFARLEGSLTEGEAEQAYRQSVELPAARPPVDRAHVALDGRIWLGWSAPPGQPETWWVLDAEGRQLAAFTAPPGLDVRGAGADFVWTVESTGSVPALVRYGLGEALH